MEQTKNHRPMASWCSAWVHRVSTLLVRSAVTPYQISITSLLCAVAGALALVFAGWIGMVLCALVVQGRLLCNLLADMLSLQTGKMSALDVIGKEFCDRLADSLFIVALGYLTPHHWLGWAGALAAALAAFTRVLSTSLGLPADSREPMGSTQRMAVLTLACLGGAIEAIIYGSQGVLLVASVVILAGSALTCLMRMQAMAEPLP